MNPLRQDDPRHLKAVEAARFRTKLDTPADIIAAYFASLKAQGVVLIEAYAGDDTGR